MDIQADTSQLETGAYNLILSQVDGKSHDVRLTVLPPMPVVENFPLIVNQGTSSASLELKGKRLDLLERVDITRGSASLGAASSDGTSRTVSVKLPPGIDAGTDLAMRAAVANRSEPVAFPDALRIAPPLPAITAITLSQPPVQQIHLDAGELPGAVVLSAMIRVANLPPDPSVRLECQGAWTGAVTLAPAEQSRGARLEQLTSDQLFLTFDTANWINDCHLEASLHGSVGSSAPRTIGRVVDVPSIDQFSIDPIDGSSTLVGLHLETIEKAGWTPDRPVPVAALPQPQDDGQHQKLDLHLPAPPTPDCVLYLWLRGDRKARETTLRAN